MNLPDAVTHRRRADFAFSAVVIGGIVLSALLYLALGQLVALLLISGLLAYALLPLVDWLAKKLPRWLAVATVGIGVLGVLVGAVAISVPLVSKELQQSDEIAARMKEMGTKAWSKIKERLPAGAEQKVEQATESAVDSAKEGASTSKYAEWAKKAGSAISTFASGMVFIPIFVVLMLFGYHRLLRHSMQAVPKPWQSRFVERGRELDTALSGFVRGQLLMALILAVLYATAFAIIGIPMGIVVGLFAGFGELVPYLGNGIGLLLGVLLAFAGGNPMDAVWVVAVFAVIQALEGFVLGPLIVGKKANLRPIALLVAITLGGELFGIVGLLLAVPVAAMLKVAFAVFISAWRQTDYFENGRRRRAHA